MRALIIGLLFSVLCLSANGQSVGEEVRYQCFCFGQEWVKGTIERVDGNNVRVRYGNMDNQVVTLPANSPKLRMGNAARNPLETVPMDQMQKAFSNENGRFQNAVQSFAHYYDPRFLEGGSGLPGSALWQTYMAELAQLDSLCRTRYRGITDWSSPGYIREGVVDYRYGLWCEVAANRTTIEKKARVAVANTVVGMGYSIENLNFGFNEPENPLRMEVQEMLWNREKWRAAKIAELKPRYATYGITSVPADATAEVEKRAAELWKLVERGAPNRFYKQPPHRDAAVEAFVRAKFTSQYPGAQVLKIGLDYNTWVQRKSLTYVESDEIFKYYKVNYNSYKRGSVLLKIPGRPFCQMQEWVVGKGSQGLVAAGMGGSGTFMRCE
ncbi:MAG: hypothetical protein KA746_13800 [Pyrinomonadaceae bacterium]|nr:hypothetical protein [Pyrinomonadaceae bacterium]MBP6211766.1 hypothetical protein [Pyrinomonadaceae bacterium]